MNKPPRGVYQYGDESKPTLVLLHSIATSSEIWAPLIPILKRDYHVVCIDLPGHGDAPEFRINGSMADFAAYVELVLDKLRIIPHAMIGISLGGMVAQAYAINYPSKLKTLVLANCGAYTPDAVKDRWQGRIEAALEGGMITQIDDTLARWFTTAFAERSSVCTAWIGSLVASTTVDGYVKAVQAIQQLDHRSELPAISVPTLLILGGEDRAIPSTAVELMQAALPNAKLSVLEGVAHLSVVQAPWLFAEAVGSFVEGVFKT